MRDRGNTTPAIKQVALWREMFGMPASHCEQVKSPRCRSCTVSFGELSAKQWRGGYDSFFQTASGPRNSLSALLLRETHRRLRPSRF